MNGFVFAAGFGIALAYALSAAAYAAVFAGSRPAAGSRATALLLLSAIAHVGYLWAVSVSAARPPLYDLFEAAGVLALALALVYLHVESRMKEKTAGVFVACMSACLMAVSVLAGDCGAEADSVVSSQGPIVLHIAPAIIAYAGFTLSFVTSCMYLLQHYGIRRNRFGLVFDRLPPLEALGDMNLRSIWFGVFFLALAMAAGAFFSARAFDFRNLLDFKAVSVAAGWAIFLAAAALGKIGILSRWRVAVASIAGFAVLASSMAVVNPALSRFHRFL